MFTKPGSTVYHYVLKKILFLEKEEGREKERERNIHV